jgi:hypothetical protein
MDQPQCHQAFATRIDKQTLLVQTLAALMPLRACVAFGGWKMQNVIGIIPFTLCVALSITKADSISLASAPIETRVVRAEPAAMLPSPASRDGSPSVRFLPRSFFDKATFEKATSSSAVTTGSTAYLFLSTLGFGANYPIGHRQATFPADGRRAAFERGSSTHAARGGIEELGRRVYRVLFETRIRVQKPRRPSD